MNGIWLRDGDPEAPSVAGASGSRTNMNIKFEANNLNPLFNQFGYADAVKGGTGKLEGKLSWPGHAYQFRLENLSGEFKIEARKGQFSNVQPGAAKLLGLLSLQSIPRRLTFDFGDIFSKGFAFEKIDANVKINNGIMVTDDLEISGPAATVRMSGQVSLPAETYNLSMMVRPRVDESVALGAGALGGPVIGVAVFALQKLLQNPFEKVLSVEYKVTGPWSDPQVDPIKAVVPEKTPVPAIPPKSATEPAQKSP